VITRFVCLLVLVALGGLNQQTSAATAAKPPVPQLQQRSPGDVQIERTLRAKLAKSKLAADHFTFTVSKGVVTIEGTTSVMQHKGVMTRMARTSGATTVRNNIRVTDEAKAKAVASLSRRRTTSSDTQPPASIPRAAVVPGGNQR
jgi:hypothetical protein